MKLKRYDSIPDSLRDRITMLYGIVDRKIFGFAKREKDGAWGIYRDKRGLPLDVNPRLELVERCRNVQEAEAYLRKQYMTTYCREVDASEEETTKTKPASRERRRHSKKSVHLTGRYYSAKSSKGGDISIDEISITGLTFRPMRKHDIRTNDVLMVKFSLDDEEKTKLAKKVVVRQVAGGSVKAQYQQLHLDAALDKYLRE